ncbi:hypothetical protein ACH61_02077 [Rathayibacter tanaceti]|nr:hypothetical protein ACH61_02077 [Rathayibacter tanaceti]
MKPTPEADREASVRRSPLLARYGAALDRESAREILARRLDAAADAEEARVTAEQRAADEADRAKDEARRAKEDAAASARRDKERAAAERAADQAAERSRRRTAPTSRSTRRDKTVVEEVLGSSVGKTLLREVVRGIFGTARRR